MTDTQQPSVISEGTPIEERESRLSEGADQLASSARRPNLGHDRFLLTASAALMSVGLSIILLGWIGAARSTLMEEQIPYLISGGLLGVALSLIGAVVLLAHRLTILVRENRARELVRREDHQELMAVLRSLAADGSTT